MFHWLAVAYPSILSPSRTMLSYGKRYYIDMLAQYSDDTPCFECTGGGLVSTKVSAATAISSLPGMKGSGCTWDTMESLLFFGSIRRLRLLLRSQATKGMGHLLSEHMDVRHLSPSSAVVFQEPTTGVMDKYRQFLE
jgi:hypothetical protein